MSLVCRILVRRYATSFNDIDLKQLRSIVGDVAVKASLASRVEHSLDEGPILASHLPSVVVYPACAEQVSAIAKYASSRQIPLVPFGTGTGLEGGVIPATEGTITLNLSDMTKLVAYPEDFSATVEAGVTRIRLNDELHSSGLWFPVDPGADASLCGMAATCASGTTTLKYGGMRTNVKNLHICLSDGRLLHTAGAGRRPKMRSAGYDLTNLLVGSEGTLALILSATLRLYGLPEHVRAATVSFKTADDAVAVVTELLNRGISLARMEFLDDFSMAACNKFSHMDYAESPTLFLELHGTESDVTAQYTAVNDVCSRIGSDNVMWADTPEDRSELWTARHNILYATKAMCPGAKTIITDVCVPTSRLPEMLKYTRETLPTGLIGTVLGHVGDGNLHVILCVPEGADRDRLTDLAEEFKSAQALYALSLGGTCTGEHGVGIGKRALLQREMGDRTMEAMRLMKSVFDPMGIMNPGKIFL